MLQSENCEQESNPMPKPLYLYLSGTTLLVSFRDPIKLLPDAKSVFKSLDHQISPKQIYKFAAAKEGSDHYYYLLNSVH